MAANPESGGGGLGSRDSLKKLKIQTLLALTTIAVAAVLMFGKMYADSEPGAIPLLLVVLGIGWYLVTRARIRAHLRVR